jgi:hypothetical protein
MINQKPIIMEQNLKANKNDIVGKLLLFGENIFVIKNVVENRIIVIDDFGYEFVFLKNDFGVSIEK